MRSFRIKIKKIFPCGFIFLVGTLPVKSSQAQTSSYQWAAPFRIGVATCFQFKWVNDLSLTTETTSLFKRAASDQFGLAPNQIDFWDNGNAEEFLIWLKEVSMKGNPDTYLILYFATHQRSDGRAKFSNGPDLLAAKLIEAINSASQSYRSVLFIDDSCYAANLEKQGNFSEKVIRFYSSTEEEAIDLNFEKGPYGLDEFFKKEKEVLKSTFDWTPRGLSFLATMGVKAAVVLSEKRVTKIDLQMLLEEMNRSREIYDDEVRHRKVQHFQLTPPTANLELLKRRD